MHSRQSGQHIINPCIILLVVSCSLRCVLTTEGHEEPERHPNDGWFNNPIHPDWGAIDTILLRMSKAAYTDGSYKPSGSSRPNPLEISNIAFKGDDNLGSRRHRTALLVYFGQQLVEEIVDAQRPGCPREYFNIKVPKDHQYNPYRYDDLQMPFLRSRYDQRTGHSPNNPRQQLNEITPYIDGNLFYGAGKAWEDSLRSFKDGLLLATSADVGDAFPVPNDIRLPYANPPIPRDHILKPVKRFRRYGNPRTHENPFLNALGLVWFRYHNYIAAKIKRQQPTWNDEQLFTGARKRVIAQYQKIVMYEWLPAWLEVKENGDIFDMKLKYPYQGGPLNKYKGYDPNVHPGISVEFQAAAMRYGHSLVPSNVVTQIIRQNICHFTTRDVPSKYTNNHSNTDTTTTHRFKTIRLCNSFWVPEETLEGPPGVSSVLMGMLYTRSAREDHIIVSDIREKTFGPLEWSSRDLGALNIQRGRDHGLPCYNDVREAYGLPRVEKWADISRRPELQPILKNLSDLYGSQIPDELDVFPGGLLETSEDGPGDLFSRILMDQFLRIRHGDRFWYENRDNKLFNQEEIDDIESTNFFDVLSRVVHDALGDRRHNAFICASSVRFINCTCQDPVVDTQGVHETCPPLQHYDYFWESEYVYIMVIALLILLIALTVGVMMAMAKHRQRKLAAITYDERHQTKLADFNQFYATEWVGRSNGGLVNSRDVLVELNNQRFKIFMFNYVGHVVRMIDIRKRANWTDGQCKVFMRASCDRGYRLLIFNVPGEIDIVLYFRTQHERESAVNKIIQFFNIHKWSVQQAQPMAELLMWREAMTVDDRNNILARFFRGILKELCMDDSCKNSTFDPNNPTTTNDGQVEEDVLRTKLTRTEFADALGLQPQSLFVRNMFILADTDGEGFLSFDEFKNYFGILCSGSQGQKAEMFFKMFDTKRTGRMTKEIYKNMMKSMSEMNDAASAPRGRDLNVMVDKVFKKAGVEEQGYMTLTEFKNVFFSDSSDAWRTAIMNLELSGQNMPTIPKQFKNRQPSMMERAVSVVAEYRKSAAASKPLSSMTTSSGVSVPSPQREVVQGQFLTWYIKWTRYADNHWRQIFWLSLYILVTVGIFAERFHYFLREREHTGLRRITGYGVSVTRGAASAMMFTFSSLLVTMCRNILTYLRETILHRFIPFDSAYDMHKCIGWMAVFFTVVHVVGHMFNFYNISTQPSTDLNCYFREFFRSSDQLASFQYWFFTTITGVTGFILTGLLVLMVVFAVPYARKHVFHYFAMTHSLYIFVYFLMFLHGAGRLVQEPFWAWFFLGPMVMFILDKTVSVCRIKVLIPVQQATLLPSEVISLIFRRPLSFNYQSGQWVRIACPDLGKTEYHPFTLTSSPHEDHLSLHIRAVGPWTNNLRGLFKQRMTAMRSIKLYLDGPFGESHQDWYRFPVSVLIGGGIGITPFASILKDIAHNFKHMSHERIPCKKVYFMWVTRTQKSFEWMTDIIQEVEAADTADFVDIEICITQMKDKFDLRTAMLYVCERHFQKIAGVSMFTGLRARTHFGRPKFGQFFRSIKHEHSMVDQVGVFTCGPPALIRNVELACSEANSSTKPSLIHHYENF